MTKKTKRKLSLMVRCVLWAGQRFALSNKNIRRALGVLQRALAQENKETKEMMQIYLKQARGEATPEQLKQANAQFLDILKAAGLGAYALLPFSLVTLPFFVLLGRKMGIEILPSAFQNIVDDKTDSPPQSQSQPQSTKK